MESSRSPIDFELDELGDYYTNARILVVGDLASRRCLIDELLLVKNNTRSDYSKQTIIVLTNSPSSTRDFYCRDTPGVAVDIVTSMNAVVIPSWEWLATDIVIDDYKVSGIDNDTAHTIDWLTDNCMYCNLRFIAGVDAIEVGIAGLVPSSFDCIFIGRETTESGRRRLYDYAKYSLLETYDEFCGLLDRLDDHSWLVLHSYLLYNYTVRKKLLDTVRQLNVELVSVPAGRFGKLLPDGGVEYRRQLAQFGELTTTLN